MAQPIPNPRFSGMSAVNSETLFNAANMYLPGAIQPNVNRLNGLNTVHDLDSLINYCIQGKIDENNSGMNAFGDSIPQRARRITACPDAIEKAKAYVRGKVNKYLSEAPYGSAKDYDTWHKEICETLSNPAEHFADCGIFSVGNAQKFLNMLMKNLYACLYITSEKTQSEHGALTRLTGYQSFNQSCNDIHNYMKAAGHDFNDYFTWCHMPLDGNTLYFLKDICHRFDRPFPLRCSWSRIETYKEYYKAQDIICMFVHGCKREDTQEAAPTVLHTEFVIWPLYTY